MSVKLSIMAVTFTLFAWGCSNNSSNNEDTDPQTFLTDSGTSSDSLPSTDTNSEVDSDTDMSIDTGIAPNEGTDYIWAQHLATYFLGAQIMTVFPILLQTD